MGVAMALSGAIVFALSIYMLFVADASWKWIVGLTDGLFAIVVGLLVLQALRVSLRPDDEGDSDRSDALPTPDRTHPLVGRGLDRDWRTDRFGEPALDRVPVRS